MKEKRLRLLFVALAVQISSQTLAAKPADCQDRSPTGSICLLAARDLHPTQFAVGDLAVECKRRDIEKKQKKGKLEDWLAEPKRHVPAVVGPDGNFYITDHHHLSTAVFRAAQGDWRGKNQKLHLSILENFHDTGISMDEFWKIMEMQNNVWRFDEEGKEVGDYGDRLPKMDLGDLKDNPYRTLSRWTRESCGYIKQGKDQCLALEATDGPPSAPYFMEFHWAEFLRAELKKDNKDLNTPKELLEAYPRAIRVTLDRKRSTRYFTDQGLDAVDYGQNQKGKYLHLDFSSNACEEWFLTSD